MSKIKKIKIDSEFIKLDSLLKYASIVQTGGEAKNLILDEQVLLNGEVVTQRGKKIRKDDIVETLGYKIIIEEK